MYKYGVGMSPMGVLRWTAHWPSLARVVGQFLIVLNGQRMIGSGTGFAYGVICRLNPVVGVVSWSLSCTALFRGARKYCIGHRELIHGESDFLCNKPGILLMKGVKDVNGIVG